MRDNRSFFEKLTGAIKMDPEEDTDDVQAAPSVDARGRMIHPTPVGPRPATVPATSSAWMEDTEEEGELTVDVYQTGAEIVIKTMVAGVKPEDLDITITRDMVTIKGKRETEKSVEDDDYFHKELYWGSFSRTIMLPAEVEVEEAEAIEKHGLLIIKLPKIDRNKQARLKVKG